MTTQANEIDREDRNTEAGNGAVPIHPRILQWALATAVALTVGIAGASFWLSFAVLRELAAMAGIGDGQAWVIPVVLDGAIVSTTVTAIALSNHTDGRTVRGRRFVVAILRVAATASIAGNSYHAVLSATALPAVVSAGIATIAPIALLAMTEVLAVVLRAPRGQPPQSELIATEPDSSEPSHVSCGLTGSDRDRLQTELTLDDRIVRQDVLPLVEVRENEDDLPAEVTETARLRHAHREWSWARIGMETDGSVASTAMRRYRKWEESVPRDSKANYDGDLDGGGEQVKTG
ncbi:DUF2637 domain-containing protein [Rhodococcus sp. PAMC28707]|uniref:DUF2637 domain-containing protein n=1 Tax=unclassified Rhodococcus (in: high G+C Gram-positive bacteria) TaxID=192944 RepID=UPI00109DCB99|nr:MULTISPECIES: DUF2637 domain-containing protein [unclassified Rhodococcus (in: high G+C Gram-positive bacteria)]QCB51824.1 DUF2637 domain-containing protein [Rhodococcus sp. PAMC28705]QCB60007.1 DUF2637 domain-containing protein [Rhodococcus sp. PAMC28707]